MPDGADTEQPHPAMAGLEAAAEALAAGKADTAFAEWGRLRRNFPEHPGPYRAEAAALADTGRLDEAEAVLQAAVERLSESLVLLAADHARLAARRGDLEEAARRWVTLRTSFASHALGHVGAAESLIAAGQTDAAADAIAELTRRFPQDRALTILRASLSDARNDWAASCALWEDIRTGKPADPLGYIKSARALREAGRIAEADTLLGDAVERFPDVLHLHLQWAEAAMYLGRWVEAVRRWEEVQKRFPDAPEAGRRMFEARMRVVETDVAETGAALPDNEPASDDTHRAAPTNSDTYAMRTAVMEFESLGGTLQGCEFGLFQRAHGAEPLGLLRWTEMAPQNVIDGLEASFAGVGEPKHTDLGVHPTPEGPEYFTSDKRFLMSMHTFINQDQVSQEKMYSQACRRLRFLRDKLVEDLRQSNKIFVYKITWRVMTDDELFRMHAAIRRYGKGTLLNVRPESPEKPNGTVELIDDGLMLGYIDRFSVASDGQNLGANISAWTAICRRALALRG